MFFSEEIFRACRLVVDTGMHALGWEQEQAVQFMLAHTAASEDGIRLVLLNSSCHFRFFLCSIMHSLLSSALHISFTFHFLIGAPVFSFILAHDEAL